MICPDCHQPYNAAVEGADCPHVAETDLVKIAEREVVEAARRLAKEVATFHPTAMRVQVLIDEVASAVTLLTAREGMAATTHLDDERNEP